MTQPTVSKHWRTLVDPEFLSFSSSPASTTCSLSRLRREYHRVPHYTQQCLNIRSLQTRAGDFPSLSREQCNLPVNRPVMQFSALRKAHAVIACSLVSTDYKFIVQIAPFVTTHSTQFMPPAAAVSSLCRTETFTARRYHHNVTVAASDFWLIL